MDRNAAGQLSLSTELSVEPKKNPFTPPYNPQLYLGELAVQDGDDSSHYVVLVRQVNPRHVRS